MNVYKSYSFYHPLTGIRSQHSSYLVGQDFNTIEEVNEFILNDLASDGNDFEADTTKPGTICFKSNRMYHPHITYTWQ